MVLRIHRPRMQARDRSLDLRKLGGERIATTQRSSSLFEQRHRRTTLQRHNRNPNLNPRRESPRPPPLAHPHSQIPISTALNPRRRSRPRRPIPTRHKTRCPLPPKPRNNALGRRPRHHNRAPARPRPRSNTPPTRHAESHFRLPYRRPASTNTSSPSYSPLGQGAKATLPTRSLAHRDRTTRFYARALAQPRNLPRRASGGGARGVGVRWLGR